MIEQGFPSGPQAIKELVGFESLHSGTIERVNQWLPG